MGIPDNAKEYLNKKKKHFGLLLFVSHLFSNKDKNPKGLISRGYPFKDSISAEEKDKETLNIISKW